MRKSGQLQWRTKDRHVTCTSQDGIILCPRQVLTQEVDAALRIGTAQIQIGNAKSR